MYIYIYIIYIFVVNTCVPVVILFQGGAAAVGQQQRDHQREGLIAGAGDRWGQKGAGDEQNTSQNQAENDPKVDFDGIQETSIGLNVISFKFFLLKIRI